MPLMNTLTKTVYLVRHGESVANVDDVYYHGKDAPLTPFGIDQASRVAKRAARITFDVLLASPVTRAKVTAQLIAAETGHDIAYESLFREWHIPTSLEGKLRSDPESHATAKRAFAARNGFGEKVEDSETFKELSLRAAQALQYLETFPAQRILVVGHGHFTKILIARMLFADTLTPEMFKPLVWGLRIQNAGISVLNYDPSDPHRHWWLAVSNDLEHVDRCDGCDHDGSE